MAAILLDIEGVLHVSWEVVPGAVEAVERLREAGHRLRFVTNNTTRARKDLAFGLQRLGIDLEEEELQTTPMAAARALAGRRVLAKTMPRIIEDQKGIELDG
jgi:ribonucleotide monophosphatase NagD (HAD superfamily)